MPRSVNAVASRARRKKVLKLAKGYFGARSKAFTVAKTTVEKGLGYAYEHRKLKKRDYRTLWIARINAGARELGLSYSRLINLLATNNVTINRKVLADLALNNPAAFKAIVDSVRG